MLQALSIAGYIVLILGLILILVAAVTYKRKGEAEISQSLIEVPIFKIGIVLVLLGLVLKLLFH